MFIGRTINNKQISKGGTGLTNSKVHFGKALKMDRGAAPTKCECTNGLELYS